MRHGLRTALSVSAALMMGVPAYADDGPLISRRPGLWLETIGGSNPKVIRECTDHANDAALWRARTAQARPGCTEISMQRTSTGGVSRMVCRSPSGTTTTDSEMARTDGLQRGDAETYRFTIHATIEPHPAELADGVTVTMDARWAGPCPAGMNPGDTTDAAGRKLPRPAN